MCLGTRPNGNPEPSGGLALSDDGATLYVALADAQVVLAVDLATGTVSVLSGEPNQPGTRDGLDARWQRPADLALDSAAGRLLVADSDSHRIRALDLATGEVTTVAGTGEPPCELIDLLVPAVCEEQHLAGDGGPAIDALLYRPFGVALDADGNVLVADTYNHRIRIVYR
jgi:DNA-binding beta-propeller fold protein YncE